MIAEALTNIKKHAQARNAHLHLEHSDNKKFIIVIKDDGKGFDINEAESSASSCGKLGLISMRQRAISLGGKLVITSTLTQGTEVHVNISLAEKVV